MAAPLDDMFSLCVDPGKVAGSVDVRFIDNIKVKWIRVCRNKRVLTRCAAESGDVGVAAAAAEQTDGLRKCWILDTL